MLNTKFKKWGIAQSGYPVHLEICPSVLSAISEVNCNINIKLHSRNKRLMRILFIIHLIQSLFLGHIFKNDADIYHARYIKTSQLVQPSLAHIRNQKFTGNKYVTRSLSIHPPIFNLLYSGFGRPLTFYRQTNYKALTIFEHNTVDIEILVNKHVLKLVRSSYARVSQ